MAWVERVGRNTWRVRYWKDDGTLGSIRGFTNKIEAEHKAEDMEADQRDGSFIDPAHGRTSLQAWVEEWLPALDVDPRTEDNYRSALRRHILPRWGTTALLDISSIRIAAWQKDLSRRLAPATVSAIMKLFRMVIADAVAERLIPYNPVQTHRRGRSARTPRPIEQIWATHEEVLRIADQVAAYYHPCGAMLLLTAAWTGARWGELTGLHRNNLHLDDGVVIIDPDLGALHERSSGQQWLGQPKTSTSARTINLPPFLIPLLHRHLHTVDSEHVFVTPDGHWHRRSNFARRAFRPAADGNTHLWNDLTARQRRVTVATEPVKPGLTFHGLRHSHKTWMIADGVPEIAQSKRLGHTLHDKIQQTYSHVAVEVEHRLLDGLQDRWDKAVANSSTPPALASYRL